MANPSGRKGAAGETGVVDALRRAGRPYVERRAKNGAKDRGDIAGIPGVVIEVKNVATMSLSSWLTEAEVERKNDNAKYGVVWHKKKGKGQAEDWYVTMDGKTFMGLLKEAGY